MASVQSACIRFLLRRVKLWNKPVEGIREALKKAKPKGMPIGVTEESITINGVGCYAFVPENSLDNKAIVYFHGGGGCLGIYTSNCEFAARIAKECGLKVIMPDYRLAPENPFPAALEDAVAVCMDMLGKGLPIGNLALIGDSFGCGLLLSALLRLKEAGAPMPAAIAMITPALDFVGKGESFRTRADKDPFQMEDPLGVVKTYIGDNDPLSPDISPIYGNLTGLPPMLIHAADYDVFLSDAIRLKEVPGLQVELRIWQKMWHIFHMQDTVVPEAKDALAQMCAWMREKLNG